jgi:hypothetical protein
VPTVNVTRHDAMCQHADSPGPTSLPSAHTRDRPFVVFTCPWRCVEQTKAFVSCRSCESNLAPTGHFPLKLCTYLSLSPYVLHVPSYLVLFDLITIALTGKKWLQIMELLIVQLSAASCHFIPLRPKYSPQHPVLNTLSSAPCSQHPQPPLQRHGKFKTHIK